MNQAIVPDNNPQPANRPPPGTPGPWGKNIDPATAAALHQYLKNVQSYCPAWEKVGVCTVALGLSMYVLDCRLAATVFVGLGLPMMGTAYLSEKISSLLIDRWNLDQG